MATKFAGNGGGASGEKDIANMWRAHFENLYNSGVAMMLGKRLWAELATLRIGNNVHFTVHDIIIAVRKQ